MKEVNILVTIFQHFIALLLIYNQSSLQSGVLIVDNNVVSTRRGEVGGGIYSHDNI